MENQQTLKMDFKAIKESCSTIGELAEKLEAKYSELPSNSFVISGEVSSFNADDISAESYLEELNKKETKDGISGN